MNTEELKRLIQRHFDEGLELSAEAEAAIATSPSLQAYRQRLAALDDAERMSSRRSDARVIPT